MNPIKDGDHWYEKMVVVSIDGYEVEIPLTFNENWSEDECYELAVNWVYNNIMIEII